MKIALCISGHLRDGDKNTYPSLKKFMLDKYDCDIFVSSWDESGVGIQYVHQPIVEEQNGTMVNRILDKYEPVDYRFSNASDPWVLRLENRWKGILTRNGSYLFQNNCMFRKIYEADILRKIYETETDTYYDVVVRFRFDTEFVCDIIEPTLNDIHQGKLIVRSGHCGIIDQLFWGESANVTAACECFLYVPQLVSTSNSKTFENAENILAVYLKARGVPLSIRDDVKFSLTKPHGGHII